MLLETNISIKDTFLCPCDSHHNVETRKQKHRKEERGPAIRFTSPHQVGTNIRILNSLARSQTPRSPPTINTSLSHLPTTEIWHRTHGFVHAQTNPQPHPHLSLAGVKHRAFYYNPQSVSAIAYTSNVLRPMACVRGIWTDVIVVWEV
jgi:hypothetical protein